MIEDHVGAGISYAVTELRIQHLNRPNSVNVITYIVTKYTFLESWNKRVDFRIVSRRAARLVLKKIVF